MFVHGWTCDHSVWNEQAPLFSKYRSILIDLPVHGASDAPDIEYSIELFARSIHTIIREEEIKEVVLIAHSMGGPVSTMFLRLFAEAVSAIVYVDTFVWLPWHYHTQNDRRLDAQRLQGDETFEAFLEIMWSN